MRVIIELSNEISFCECPVLPKCLYAGRTREAAGCHQLALLLPKYASPQLLKEG
jgi:hypothetical protein